MAFKKQLIKQFILCSKMGEGSTLRALLYIYIYLRFHTPSLFLKRCFLQHVSEMDGPLIGSSVGRYELRE